MDLCAVERRDHDLDPIQLRRAFGCFATGVAVITTCHARKFDGVTVNSFASVALSPPLVLWSLHHHAGSLPSFRNSGRFAVNILDVHQSRLARHFARRQLDKFAGVPYREGLGGCPMLEGGLACYECSMDSSIDAGDHLVFFGRVERASFREGTPLLFSGGAFRAPKNLQESVS